MVEGNIFIHLKENKKHIEDYFTKILLFFLENNEQFREKLVTKLLGIKDIEKDSKFSVKYNLPYPPKNTRPDLSISNKDILILIEIKINTELREHQLIDYSEIIKDKLEKKEIKKGFVVFLPKYFELIQNDGKNIIEINTNNKLIEKNWSDMYTFFKNDENFTNEMRWLKNQYIELMEVENMQPFRKMDKGNLSNMGKEFSNIVRLFSELKRRLSDKGIEFRNNKNENFVKLDNENIEILQMGIKKSKNCAYDLAVSYDMKEPAFLLYLWEESKNIKRDIEKIKNYLGRLRENQENNSVIDCIVFEPDEPYSYFTYNEKESQLFDTTEYQQIEKLVEFYTGVIEILNNATKS